MRHVSRRGLAAFAFLFLLLPAWAQQPTEFFQGHEAAGREVLVKFREATPQALGQALNEADADAVEHIGGIGVYRIRSRSKNVDALVRALSARPDVLYAEPNYLLKTTAVPNDPRFSELWGLRNTSTGADIRAVPAWDLGTGSRTVVVGVVDTGVDYTHPDLSANIWSAPSSFTVTIGGATIICAAGTHGFNAITKTCNPADDNNHGTHVSGTIGAVGNNGVGVVGVNWTASIMGLKFLNVQGSGTTANAINAIEFAVQARAAFSGSGAANVRVLSNSWGGGGFSQSLLDEINRANSNNMLFTAAAGNSGTNNDSSPFYPASYTAPNVVAVAATDSSDNKASFSNYGATSVDLGAPGVGILSTVRGGAYASYSGTSMATPHVSGAAALVLSLCALDTAGLKANLLNNVDPIAALAGKTVTGGRLNVNASLQACAGSPPPPAPDFAIAASPASQTVVAGNSTTYQVTVTPSNGYTGTVSFSASGLPAGATASFNPASVTGSGSSTLTLGTSSTTPPGTYNLTITGSDGTLSHTATVQLVVNPTGDFTIAATPSSRTIPRRSSTTYTVNVVYTNGFTGAVALSVTGLPGGATASFNPASLNSSGSSVLTVNAGNSRGTFTLTITGTSGPLQHSTQVTLVVTR